MIAVVLTASGALVLSGCMGTAPADISHSPTTPTVTPTATPVAAASVVLPECDAMNATAQQQYLDFGPELFAEPAGETGPTAFTETVGPSALEAMTQAAQSRGCRWPVHSQGAVMQYVAELDQANQATLLAALRADSGIVESSLAGALTFGYEAPAPHPAMNATAITYIFVGDVWITILDYAGNRDYRQAALDGVLAVNPSLAATINDAGAAGAPSCASITAADALARYGADVPGYWDLTGQFSDVSGYDSCADLSWIILRQDPCCTRFAVSPVVFFHSGEYVPAATEARFALSSDNPVQRISGNEVAVTFAWPGADFAGAANTATSTFVWDPATGTVTRSGELPPS